MIYKELNEKAEQLEDYALMCNDEAGRYWENLAKLALTAQEIASDHFLQEINKAMQAELDLIASDYAIREEKITTTRKVTRLEYIG